MPTLIQQARAAGDLKIFFDFRGGQYTDQSGNNHTLTVPSDASLNETGLRCFAAPASVSLDLSGTQNFGVFYLVTECRFNGDTQYIAEHSTQYNQSARTDGFLLYQTVTAPPIFWGRTWISPTYTYDRIAFSAETDSVFVSNQFDRRLSYQMVKSYDRGILSSNLTLDNNVNDGSGWGNYDLYLMGRSSGSFIHQGRLQVFGIVDFSTTQWTSTQQAQLYAEIIAMETI